MRKKVLVISYRAPYPVKSGEKIRMLQNIMMLSEYFDIDLVYLDDNNKNTDITMLYEYCNNIYSFRCHKLKCCIKSILYMFKGIPFQVGYYKHGKMQKWISLNSNNYSLVFCNHIRTAQYAAGLDINKVLDYVDCNTFNLYNKKKIEKNLLKKILYVIEYKKVKQYEVKISYIFDKLMVISERDKEYLVKIGVDKDINIIYNYARDLGYGIKKSETQLTKSICFIGKMSTEPNVNAVVYFVKNIYDEVKKIYKNLEFNVIGANPTKTILKMKKIDGINILGFIENPINIINKSTLIIAPMISGSGLQNKIIESMYLEKAVITTPIGANGLADLKGDELIVACSKEDFIEKLVYYLDNNHKNDIEKIGNNARKYVLNIYSYEAVLKQFYSCIKNI